MKTRFYIIIFSVIAVFIAGLFVFQRNNKKETVELNQNRSKIVIPKTNQSENNVNEETEQSKSTESFNSFISLNPTETVISTISVDFNNDTYDDEVALIRRAGSEYVCIVPGVYNKETSSYDRLPEISTLITRANTMSVYAYDITGDHRISLIYQGIDDEDNSVMQIFIYTEDNQKPEFLLIGDFISDDTIFIQQNFYYTCRVADEIGEQELDEREQELDFVLKFVPVEEAIAANVAFKSDNPFRTQMAERERRVLEMLRDAKL